MAKKIKLRDKTGEQLIPVTRSTTVEMNDGVTLQTAYEGINSSHYTKAEINEMGYLQNYTEYDPTVPSYVKGITETDITYWNNKEDRTVSYLTYYETSTPVAVGDTHDEAISKIVKIINDNEYVTAAAITDLAESIPDTTAYVSKTELNAAGYLTSFTERDPTVPSYVKGITSTDITNWNSKTDNVGTITGITMNSTNKGTSGVVDLGTVLTEHQSLSSYVTSGYYDTSTRKIYLRHGTNVLSEIDANDFIKDGMVDTAYVQGSNLVISFNTDAGKQPVEVPIADIFNPTNYYTKTEIDNAGYLTSHQDLSSYVSKTELNAAGYLTAHQDIKTINGNTITGTGDVTISGLPEVNSTYNGKILQVVDGEWTLVTPLNLYSGTGTPNNTQGNNGDLYMQI